MGPALLLAVQVLTARDHLVLGTPPETVEIAVVAPGASAVHMVASVGRVDPLEPVAGAPGRFRTVFHAPAERYPQVAVLAAWDDAGGAGMAVLPLWGSALLPIQVDAPHAAFTLTVGSATFVGHTDAEGRADIRFAAPPGLLTGSVRAVDSLGNVKTKQVPLGIPDAPRIVLDVAPGELLADGQASARVLAFAATPDGRPDSALALEGNAPVRVLAPGVVAATVPPQRALGEVPVQARSAGQLVTRRVRFITGPPAAIEVSVRSDADGAYLITARVIDAGAHALPIAPTATSEVGTVSPFEPAPGGAYAARYQAGPTDDANEVVLRAGTIERRLRFDQPGSGRPRWEARGVFVSNLAHTTGGGLVLGASLPLGLRPYLAAEAGALALSGQTRTEEMTAVDHMLLAVPLRLGLGVGALRSGPWRLLLGAHGGVWLIRASVQGRDAAGRSFPEFTRSEIALDAGAALTLLRRLGSAGALALSVGYDYVPVESGSVVTGNLGGIEVGLGWRSRL